MCGTLSGVLSCFFFRQAVAATFLKSSAPIIVMSAPLSITPSAGTPWTLTEAFWGLLPLSSTLIVLTSPLSSESEENRYCRGSSLGALDLTILVLALLTLSLCGLYAQHFPSWAPCNLEPDALCYHSYSTSAGDCPEVVSCVFSVAAGVCQVAMAGACQKVHGVSQISRSTALCTTDYQTQRGSS